jgi:membrane fusion protein (multidrug efflux system)
LAHAVQTEPGMTRPLQIVAVSSLMLLPLAAGCGVRESSAQSPTKLPATEPSVSVKTAPVGVQALPRTITLTGTLTANRESGVAADVVGKVSEIYVERGSRVRAGCRVV